MKFSFWRFASGDNPANEFLLSQDKETHSLIDKKLQAYERWDLRDLLRLGIIQKFRNQNFHELTLGKYRFTGVIIGGIMYFVHGFKKQGNKTRPKDISTSKQRVYALLKEF